MPSKRPSAHTDCFHSSGFPVDSDFRLMLLNKCVHNWKTLSHDEALMRVTARIFSFFLQSYTTKQWIRSNLPAEFSLSDIQLLSKCLPTGVRKEFFQGLACLAVNSDQFETFIAHVCTTLARQQENISSADHGSHDDSDLQRQVIALFRDVQGMASSVTDADPWVAVVGAVHPALLQLAEEAVGMWYNNTDTITPILDCITECARNSNSRWKTISVPSSTPLFRGIARLLQTYSDVLVRCLDDGGDPHYKSATAAIQMLRMCLVGEYIPFGELTLFGDHSFDNAMDSFFKISTRLRWQSIIR